MDSTGTQYSSALHGKIEVVEKGPLGSGRLFGIRASDKAKLTKGRHEDDWSLVPHGPAPGPVTKVLLMIKEQQADKTDHWSLYVGSETGPGTIYAVIGDHLFMTYKCQKDSQILSFPEVLEAPIMLNGSLTTAQEQLVEEATKAVPPPRADSIAEIKMDCKGWVVEVTKILAKQGVVSESVPRQLDAMRAGRPDLIRQAKEQAASRSEANSLERVV